MKASLATLMEIIEYKLDVGDIFKCPMSPEHYQRVKEHILKSPTGSYQVNKQIEMPDKEKPKELKHYIVVQRLK